MAYDKEVPYMTYNMLEGKGSRGSNEVRRTTNVFALFLFILFFFTWLGFVIYALVDTPMKSVELPTAESSYFDKVVEKYGEIFESNTLAIFGCIFLTGTLMFLYIMMLKGVMARFFVVVSVIYMAMMVIVVSLSIFIHIMKYQSDDISSSDRYEYTLMVASSVFYAFFGAIVLTCVSKVGLGVITETIRESCRAVVHHSATIILGFIVLAIAMVVLLVTILSLAAILKSDELQSSIHVWMFWTIPIGGLYLICFLFSSGEMIVSACIADWYWASNKRDSSKTMILQSSVKIMRYHLGAAAFSSTGILPLFHAIYVACIWQRKSNKTYDNWFIRLICKIYLVFSMPMTALIQVSSYGHEFTHSSKKTFHLLMGNCSRYLAAINIATIVAHFGLQLVSILIGGMLLATFKSHYDLSQSEIAIAVSLIIATVMIILLAFSLVMQTAVATIIVCAFEDLEENNGAEKPYAMNADLRKMIVN